MKANVLKFKRQELEFAKAITDLGKISESNTEQDRHEHWDIKLETKFDVKAIKQIKRSDGRTDDNYHWVEFINVNGERGWLYGKADYIVFELADYWLIVDRLVLVLFIQSKCADKQVCDKPELYKIYSRGKDKMTLVRTIDLIYIAEKQILKDKTNENETTLFR